MFFVNSRADKQEKNIEFSRYYKENVFVSLYHMRDTAKRREIQKKLT